MANIFRDMLTNKYGKYSQSKVIPFVWFLYLLYALTWQFDGREIPQTYYDLTIVFSGVYVGRTALDKIADSSKKTE